MSFMKEAIGAVILGYVLIVIITALAHSPPW